MRWWTDTWAAIFFRQAEHNFVHRKMLEAKLENASYKIDNLHSVLERVLEEKDKVETENRVLRGWASKRLVDETETFLDVDE
jgi:regulator of replication initiation timing